MALTKTVVVDRIEVLQMGQIQVRRATVVNEDGTELSRNFHRHVLAPGDDTTGEDDRVAAVAAATWTTEVVAAWDAFIAAQEAELAANG
jgi:urease accessory protein UreE